MRQTMAQKNRSNPAAVETVEGKKGPHLRPGK
jgi:hypothetical protein